jgi:hypothetical protein
VQHNHGVIDGTVLRVVNDPANGAEDIGESDVASQEQAGKYEQAGSGHIS